LKRFYAKWNYYPWELIPLDPPLQTLEAIAKEDLILVFKKETSELKE
jgi:hypothetical protein